jgi:hypothetical protein
VEKENIWGSVELGARLFLPVAVTHRASSVSQNAQPHIDGTLLPNLMNLSPKLIKAGSSRMWYISRDFGSYLR